MPKTLTLRLTDEQSQALNDYQAEFEIVTASKAFLNALHWHPKIDDELRETQRQLSQAKNRIALLQQTIEECRASAAALLEVAGQGDIFD